MRRFAPAAALLTLAALPLAGCAHSKANQYTYAPPLAPPVYPQPPTAMPAMAGTTPMMAAAPIAAPGAVVGVPVAAPGMPAAPLAGQPMMGDPCCPPMDGGAVPVVYEAAGQTPQCPPGP